MYKKGKGEGKAESEGEGFYLFAINQGEEAEEVYE